MNMNNIVGPNSKGRSLGRWKDRVKEYMWERSATRGGGIGRDGGFFVMATSLGDISRGSEVSELWIDIHSHT